MDDSENSTGLNKSNDRSTYGAVYPAHSMRAQSTTYCTLPPHQFVEVAERLGNTCWLLVLGTNVGGIVRVKAELDTRRPLHVRG